jgi:hypothetical protein
MSQWVDVGGKSTEVGLSPGQTEGYVGGQYVTRPAGNDTSTVYIAPKQDTPQQSEAKRMILQSPTAQWSSPEAYQAAYRSYVASGGNPDIRPAGVFLASTLEERKAEARQIEAAQMQAQVSQSRTPLLTAAMQRTQFDYQYDLGKPITREEYLASRRAPDQYENVRKAAPLTTGFYEMTAGLSEGLTTGLNQITGYSETSHPLKKALVGVGWGFTSLPIVAGQMAVVGEYSLRNPAKLPTALARGMPIFGGQVVEQAKNYPWESVGMIAGMIIAPKVSKVVSERLPAVRIREIEMPSAKGFTDNVETSRASAPNWAATAPIGSPLSKLGIKLTQERILGKTVNIYTPVIVAPVVAGGMSYQGISVEQGRKALPVIGITDQPVVNKASFQVFGKSVVAGTPMFQPEAVPDIFKTRFTSEAGYREFMNPTEYQIATSNILPGYDVPTRELFETTIAKRELTSGIKSTHQLADVPLEDVFTRHELQPETMKNLRSYMEQQKDFVIWGSTANKAQVMGEGGIGYFREIHDIDIHVKNPLQTTQEMFDIISKTERPGFVTMKSGGLATARGHLFDIKSLEGGLPEEWKLSGSEISEGKVFLFSSEKPERIGTFKVQSLSDQATSKLSSIGLREKTISAAAHRAGKDPFDLAYINEPSLTFDLQKSWNPFKRIAAGKAEALDIKIQGLTEAKIRAQPLGSLPGQITAQQKALFFENLNALRAGKFVATLPGRELLYQAKGTNYEPVAVSGIRAAGLIAGGSVRSTGSIISLKQPTSGSSTAKLNKAIKQSGYLPTSKASKTISISGIRSQVLTSQGASLTPIISPSRVFGSSGSSSGRSPPITPYISPPTSIFSPPPPQSPPNYPRSPPSPPSYPINPVSPPRTPPTPPLTFEFKKPKLSKVSDKLTVNFRRSGMTNGYGKFPEIARVASKGRVLEIKGLIFPWEKKKKRKSSGKRVKKK